MHFDATPFFGKRYHATFAGGVVIRDNAASKGGGVFALNGATVVMRDNVQVFCAQREREVFIDNLLVRIHLITEMILTTCRSPARRACAVLAHS